MPPQTQPRLRFDAEGRRIIGFDADGKPIVEKAPSDTTRKDLLTRVSEYAASTDPYTGTAALGSLIPSGVTQVTGLVGAGLFSASQAIQAIEALRQGEKLKAGMHGLFALPGVGLARRAVRKLAASMPRAPVPPPTVVPGAAEAIEQGLLGAGKLTGKTLARKELIELGRSQGLPWETVERELRRQGLADDIIGPLAKYYRDPKNAATLSVKDVTNLASEGFMPVAEFETWMVTKGLGAVERRALRRKVDQALEDAAEAAEMAEITGARVEVGAGKAAARKKAGAEAPPVSELALILHEIQVTRRLIDTARRNFSQIRQRITRGRAEESISATDRAELVVAEREFREFTVQQNQRIKTLQDAADDLRRAGKTNVTPGAVAPEVASAVQASAQVGERVASISPEAAEAVRGAVKRARDSMTGRFTKLDPKTKKDAEDAGFAMMTLLSHLALAGTGAVAGGVAGAQARPEDAEKSRGEWIAGGAASGAVMGLLASGMVTGTVAAGTRGLINKLLDQQFFNLLSDPGPLGRANLGALSSVFIKAVERMGEGRFKEAAAGIRGLLSDAKDGTWFKVLFPKDPMQFLPPEVAAALKDTGRLTSRPGVMGITGRVIGAGDIVSTRAMLKMGTSRQEILRMNLSGSPQTKTGQTVLRALGEDVWAERALPGGGVGIRRMEKTLGKTPAGQLLARTFMPFPRVAVAIPERTLAYTLPAFSKTARMKFSEVPGQAMSRAQAMTRLGLAGGAYAGGYYGAAAGSPQTDIMLPAAAGPLAGLATLGMLTRRAGERDLPGLGLFAQALQEVPLVGEAFRWPVGRLVPGALRTAARLMDPAFEREGTPSSIQAMMRREGEQSDPLFVPSSAKELVATSIGDFIKRLPVVREGLPERFEPVDAKGQPLFPTNRPMFIPDLSLRGSFPYVDIVAPKLFTGTPQINPPILPVGDPTADILRRVQQRAGGPQLLGAPTQPTRDEMLSTIAMLSGQPEPVIHRDVRRAALAARGGIPWDILGQVVQSPGFEQMDPAVQSLLIRRMMSQLRGKMGESVTPLVRMSMMAPSTRGDITTILQALSGAGR